MREAERYARLKFIVEVVITNTVAIIRPPNTISFMKLWDRRHEYGIPPQFLYFYSLCDGYIIDISGEGPYPRILTCEEMLEYHSLEEGKFIVQSCLLGCPGYLSKYQQKIFFEGQKQLDLDFSKTAIAPFFVYGYEVESKTSGPCFLCFHAHPNGEGKGPLGDVILVSEYGAQSTGKDFLDLMIKICQSAKTVIENGNGLTKLRESDLRNGVLWMQALSGP